MTTEEKPEVSLPDRHVFLRAETREREDWPWKMVAAGRDKYALQKEAPDVMRRAEQRDPLARVMRVNAFEEAERLYRPHAARAERNQMKDDMPASFRESFAPTRDVSRFDRDYEGLTYTLKGCEPLAAVDFSKDPEADTLAFKVLFVWGETKK